MNCLKKAIFSVFVFHRHYYCVSARIKGSFSAADRGRHKFYPSYTSREVSGWGKGVGVERESFPPKGILSLSSCLYPPSSPTTLGYLERVSASGTPKINKTHLEFPRVRSKPRISTL